MSDTNNIFFLHLTPPSHYGFCRRHKRTHLGALRKGLNPMRGRRGNPRRRSGNPRMRMGPKPMTARPPTTRRMVPAMMTMMKMIWTHT